MASDGEGATHLITRTVTGATDVAAAETLSKSVISSTLTKAAIFGADANWGRVLCAMGYSGVEFDPDQVSVAFRSNAGSIDVCKHGRGLSFDEALAKKILTEHDVTIAVTVGSGAGECTCWGCDITYDYIKINGDYRT
jgi:glutamate N-acetyltransferase/amino-acid N-acetyltransferase